MSRVAEEVSVKETGARPYRVSLQCVLSVIPGCSGPGKRIWY
jgi:hypothetical protein